ncbi:MAG: heat-inducible transcriptional repressor HrcA [Defluviitaleaceae bacterium]|nr:heat-inducible transcriptional repressor HrcA [Defluviitaleaceae bacterium]MCL2262772.1 heat-inducible transcriptional repressor HrcA [Defluviitaleaceae bacterium]
MLLNERKFKILQAIVSDYIETAEPIGSRTIAKKYELGISSATIRNEMSDLEDMGLISQLHTSSGRVPSEKGYRFYVDSMMQSRALTSDEAMFLQQMLIENIYQAEYMMRETAKALARLTKYPAIVSEPFLKKTTIKHIQLVPLDEKSLLLVLVTDTKTVKNQVVNLNTAPNYETLTKLSAQLNTHLAGLSIREINRQLIDKMLMQFGEHAHVLMPVLGIIADMIQSEDDVRVFTSGVKNILAFPEFSDKTKAEAIFNALEDRASLFEILGQPLASPQGIQIIIGAENHLDLLKACSLIKANYTIDNQSTGCIALIGPMRMDYAQAVSVVSGILQSIQNVIKALGGTQ